jgi:hypothetical protein
MKAKSPLWKKWNRFILARRIREELDVEIPSTHFKDRGSKYALSGILDSELGVMLTAVAPDFTWEIYSVRDFADLFDLCTLQRILKKVRQRNASWWSMNREMSVRLHQYLVERVEYQLTPQNHWLP